MPSARTLHCYQLLLVNNTAIAYLPLLKYALPELKMPYAYHCATIYTQYNIQPSAAFDLSYRTAILNGIEGCLRLPDVSFTISFGRQDTCLACDSLSRSAVKKFI